MPFSRNPDLIPLLDGLAQGILIFDPDGALVVENRAARIILGTDLAVIRQNGLAAAAVLLNQQLPEDSMTFEGARQQAAEDEAPVRFQTQRNGEFQPCAVSVIAGPDSQMYTMISLDAADWGPLAETVRRFGAEISSALESAKGHTDLIQQVIERRKPNDTADQLAKRLSGFNTLIRTEMIRSQRLMAMLERLADIRLGVLDEQVKARRKRIDLAIFLEDLTEELNQHLIVDPETDAGDIRSRITVTVAEGLSIDTSAAHLTRVLHDILANAIMYSLRSAPVQITARKKSSMIQIDVQDEGYGIRESERERVFIPFERAHQPQIIGEFGYGLSLYLCKHEVEAMNGRIWFDSIEGTGTTFSITLPLSSSRAGKP